MFNNPALSSHGQSVCFWQLWLWRDIFYLIANFGACWILSVNTCRNSLHTLGPGVILAKLLHIVDKFRQKHRPLHHLRVEPWSKPRGRGLSSPIGCDLYVWDQSEKFGRHSMEVKLNVVCAEIGRNIPIGLSNTVLVDLMITKTNILGALKH